MEMEMEEGVVGSILDSIGTEFVGVMSPVSVCMVLVVAFVSAVPPSPTAPPVRSAATLLYLESPSDPSSVKLKGAILNATAFVALIALSTFLMVLLYYFRLTSFLRHYITLSAAFVFAVMGGPILFSLLRRFRLPLDAPSALLLILNFSALGVLSVFRPHALPVLLRQSYMVALAVIVAAWFAYLPNWTAWVLLLALALYDLVAVLAPGGPLRLLVELASRRDEDLPALIYEARPTLPASSSSAVPVGLLVTMAGPGSTSSSVELQPVPSSRRNSPPNSSDHSAIEIEEESAVQVEAREDSPLVATSNATGSPAVERRNGDEVEIKRGIKLGLGDFVFYSVLVGRAAVYDLTTVYACYLAIISGLACTLILLSVCRRALPALPISIALGVVFYFLTRLLMEPFVVGISTHLLMF